MAIAGDPSPSHDEFPEATVLVLIRDPGPREAKTFDLLKAQVYPGRFKVHVVDSSPDPNAEINVAIRNQVDRYEVIPPESFKHGPTRNIGVDACSSEVFVSLSSDAQPIDEHCLKNLVAPIAEGRAEASHGRQRSPFEDAERAAAYSYWYPDHPEIKSQATIGELGMRALHFTDVFSAFRADTIKAIRFPDVSIFQDLALMKSLIDAGCRVAYEPGATVLHAHPLSYREMWKRYRGLGEVGERYGVFDAVKEHRSLMSEGMRVIRGLTPTMRLTHPSDFVSSVAMAVVKAGAIAQGRRDAARRPSLEVTWTKESGSIALRKQR